MEGAIGPGPDGDGLGTRIDRPLALGRQNAEMAIEITSEQAASPERPPCRKRRPPASGKGTVEPGAPGELLSAGTFFVGRLEGVGKVCRHAVGGTCGSCAFGLPYVCRPPEAAVAVLHDGVLAVHRNLALPVKAVPADDVLRGREIWKRGREVPSRGA